MGFAMPPLVAKPPVLNLQPKVSYASNKDLNPVFAQPPSFAQPPNLAQPPSFA